MCLVKKGKGFKTAIEDITVYKLFYKKSNGYLMSPFRNHLYKLNQKEGSELSEHPYVTSYGTFKSYYRVEKGLHAFTTEGEATFWIWEHNTFPEEIVVECIIPKGSLYAEGISNDIVSNQLIPIKICV